MSITTVLEHRYTSSSTFTNTSYKLCVVFVYSRKVLCTNTAVTTIKQTLWNVHLVQFTVEVDDDGDIFGRQRINGTDRIFVR